MDSFKRGWFTERNELWPGMCISVETDKVLYEGKSEFQEILVIQTKTQGTALVLDGIIQCTEHDEFSYQEMISFLPLCSHPNPKKVLIVGGGDGGVAREVSKHPLVESVDQVEIDGEVMEVCKKYLPWMAAGLSHPKVTVYVEDGFKFIKGKKGIYDVIITDSSDPVGPAIPLFQEDYFKLLSEALKPGGIVCSQAGTFWSSRDFVTKTFKTVQKVFPAVAYAFTTVPTYPDGIIGFTLGSLNPETSFKEPTLKFNDDELNQLKMKYYTSEVHRAAFALPKFISDTFR
uniref:Spermidine synthase n=1 Tax=Lygus hesperus TaxID=30085 RepID=A0A146L2V2_LYGHE